jgi:hypothetical protein
LIKLPLKTENALQWIALITVAFSLIGFFYANYFYGSFGIDVANYFSLSDYLAVSVTKIYSIFFLIIGMIFSGSFEYHLTKQDIKKGIDPNSPLNRKLRQIQNAIFFFTLAFMTIASYILNHEMYYYGLFGILWIIILEILLYIVQKYSLQPYYFYLIGVMTYILLFSASILADIHKIRSTTSVPTIVYIDNNQSNSYTILGANSTYIFLYDRNQSKSFVYPTEKLEHIEIQNPSESNATRAAIMSFVKSGKDYIASIGNEKDMNVSK